MGRAASPSINALRVSTSGTSINHLAGARLRKSSQLRTVHVAPHERGDGLTHVVLRTDDYVRHVDERFADHCALVA